MQLQLTNLGEATLVIQDYEGYSDFTAVVAKGEINAYEVTNDVIQRLIPRLTELEAQIYDPNGTLISQLAWSSAGADAGAGSTVAPIDYYVNDTTGSNANDGLTPATAFATINNALRQTPENIEHPVKIHLAAGSYNETLVSWPFRIGAGGSLWIMGDVGLVSGESERTVDIFLDSIVGDSTASWSVDEWEAKWVRITEGLGVGQQRKILTNTSDTLVVSRSWTTIPNGTSKFKIIEPTTLITGTAVGPAGLPYTVRTGGFISSRKYALVFDQLAFSGAVFDTTGFTANTVSFAGLWSIGAQELHLGYSDLDVGGSTYTNHSGCFMGPSIYGGVATCLVDGAKVVDLRGNVYDGGFSCTDGETVLIYGGRSKRIAATSNNCSIGRVKWARIQHNFNNEVNYTRIEDGGHLTLQDIALLGLYDANVSDSADYGVHMDRCPEAEVGFLRGTGNATFGLEIGQRCQVSAVRFGFYSNTITGTSGDFKIGVRGAETWADFELQPDSRDDDSQRWRATVPATPFEVDLGRAIKGMAGLGLTKVHNVTDNTVLVEEATGTPAAGEFHMAYATGVVTFNSAQEAKVMDIYFSPTFNEASALTFANAA